MGRRPVGDARSRWPCMQRHTGNRARKQYSGCKGQFNRSPRAQVSPDGRCMAPLRCPSLRQVARRQDTDRTAVSAIWLVSGGVAIIGLAATVLISAMLRLPAPQSVMILIVVLTATTVLGIPAAVMLTDRLQVDRRLDDRHHPALSGQPDPSSGVVYDREWRSSQ